MRIRVGLALVAVALASVASAACNASVRNMGEAMSPTLKDDQFVTVTRAFKTIGRGDIVVFKYPRDESKSFVKRVVGVPGDQISSTDGIVSINGKPLDEPYVVEGNRSHDTWGPIAIPAEQYFTMGDNRRNSSDSRHWGTVKRGAIWVKVDR